MKAIIFHRSDKTQVLFRLLPFLKINENNLRYSVNSLTQGRCQQQVHRESQDLKCHHQR